MTKSPANEWDELEGIIRFAKSDYAVEEVKKYVTHSQEQAREDWLEITRKTVLSMGLNWSQFRNKMLEVDYLTIKKKDIRANYKLTVDPKKIYHEKEE